MYGSGEAGGWVCRVERSRFLVAGCVGMGEVQVPGGCGDGRRSRFLVAEFVGMREVQVPGG